jgi:hypothetical protein
LGWIALDVAAGGSGWVIREASRREPSSASAEK